MKTILHSYRPKKMEQTECSETSAHKIQTPENHPEESIQHSEHGESLKSRIIEFARRLRHIMRNLRKSHNGTDMNLTALRK